MDNFRDSAKRLSTNGAQELMFKEKPFTVNPE